jgi:murein L,D-transpeptidase YafK
MKHHILLIISILLLINSTQAQKQIDSLCVYKSKREMQAFFKHKLLKTYNIGLGLASVGKKHFQGDGRTPEGLYFISAKNAKSKYNKALVISYPNLGDEIYALWKHKNPGGAIEIHGLPAGYLDASVPNGMNDWTAGCIAIKNADINALFDIVPINCPILILP